MSEACKIAALLLLFLSAAHGMPAWYACNATNCAAPSCLCASNSAPGGLAPADTPQFILITHDDAINPFSNKVMRSITDVHTNPNGCNVPATWYTLEEGSECATAKKLWEENHEIALHTVNHTPLSLGYKGDMVKEMLDVRTWLNQTCGIPMDDILGYRTPFLVNNNATRKIIHDAGLLYDASMIEAFQEDSEVETAPGQRVWPFTMDQGIPINCNWNFPDGQCNQTSEKYPGLWEVPLWELQNSNGDHLFSMDPTGDVYNILVENFNMNYQNNRAPFGLFVHAPWFNKDTTAATNKFLDYAFAQPNVWAVTTTQLIRWMQNPVPASQMNEWYTCNPVDLTQVDEVKCQLYTAQAGNSSYTIATDFAVVISDLLAANPELGDGSKLTVGQDVRIPPWDASCVGDGVIKVTGPGQAASAASPMGGPGLDSMGSMGANGHSMGSKPSDSAKEESYVLPPSTEMEFDVNSPSSGANVTMLLAGRPLTAFQTDLKGPFVAATARALGLPVEAVRLLGVTIANNLGGRRLQQADLSKLPEVNAVLRIGSLNPVGLYNNATVMLGMNSTYNTDILPLFQLRLAEEPDIVPFENYEPMEIGSDGQPIDPTKVAAGPASSSTDSGSAGSSGLSGGAIAGIVIGCLVVSVVAIVSGYFIFARHRGTARRTKDAHFMPAASGKGDSSPVSSNSEVLEV